MAHDPVTFYSDSACTNQTSQVLILPNTCTGSASSFCSSNDGSFVYSEYSVVGCTGTAVFQVSGDDADDCNAVTTGATESRAYAKLTSFDCAPENAATVTMYSDASCSTLIADDVNTALMEPDQCSEGLELTCSGTAREYREWDADTCPSSGEDPDVTAQSSSEDSSECIVIASPTSETLSVKISGLSCKSSSSSLSDGAKAGIAIGCIVGGLLLIGLAYFLYLKSREGRATFSNTAELGKV